MRRRCRSRSAGIITDALVGPVAVQYVRVMAKMNVLLPDDLQSWTDTRVAQGQYGSSSDYMRDLVRRDRDDAQTLETLRAAIDKGLVSGRSERTIEQIIHDRRKRDGLT